MVRVLEIVLNLPEPTVLAWLEQRGQLPERIDIALAEALDALPGFERVQNDDAPRTVCGFDNRRKLTGAGWRVTSETSEAGRRAIASHQEMHAPGVTVRRVVCDVALEPDAPLDAAFGDAPAELARVLANAGELTTVATLESRRRMQWQRQSARGMAVDVALEMAGCMRADTDPALTLRELRVSTHWPDDEDDEDDGDDYAVAEAATGAAVDSAVDPTSGCEAQTASADAALARVVPSIETALAALFEIANELVRALPAFPVLADAFDRACRIDVPRDSAPARAQPIDLDGVRTPHRALLEIESNIAVQWFGNEAAVRDAPDVEFIHQLRVAQRRLKTATKIFPAWTDAAWTTRVAPRLKWLSDLLGQARDWDVFTDSTLPELAQADVDAAAWQATRAAADERRLGARSQVQQALRSSAYAELVLAWFEWISDLAVRGTPEALRGRSLRGYAKKRVAKHYRRVTRETKLTALDEAKRHRVRIQAKRLRYTLEFFEPIVSHKTRREVTKTLSRIQSVLGDGNDAAVALHFLEQLDVAPYQVGFARGWCEALKRLTAKEGERLLGELRKPKIVSGGAG